MARTNAENCRNYYNRKKAARALEKQQKPVPIKKTGAERARACRLRKKMLAQGNQSFSGSLPRPVAIGTNLNRSNAATISLSNAEHANIRVRDILPDPGRDFVMDQKLPQPYIPTSTMDDLTDPLLPVQIKTEMPFEKTMESEEIVSSSEDHTNPDESYSVNYRNETPVCASINVVNFDRNGSIVASTSTGKKAPINQPLRRNSIHKNVKQNLPITVPPNALDINLKEKVLKTYSKGNKTKSEHRDENNATNNIDTENTSTDFDTRPQIKLEIKEEVIDDEFCFKTNENQFIDENDGDQTNIDVSSSVATDVLISAHSVCSVCNKSFPTESFATHECVNKNFVCVQTESQQKSDSRVEYSNDEEHDNRLLCFSCRRVFESVDLLKSHRLECMSVKPELVYNADKLTCGFCEETFKNKTELKEHNSLTHFWCNICFSLWKTADVAVMHNESHKKYYCEACKCYFDTVKQLTYHEHKILHNKLIPSVKIDKPFVCDRCSTRFDLKYKLIEHRNDCKSVSKKPVEICCKVCSKKFNFRYMYLRHVQSKCETKFKCRFYCNKVFGSFDSLEKHIRTHYKEEILWCRLCNLTFKEKASIDHHVCVALQCKICCEMFLKKDFNKHKCFEAYRSIVTKMAV